MARNKLWVQRDSENIAGTLLRNVHLKVAPYHSADADREIAVGRQTAGKIFYDTQMSPR